MYRYSVTLLLLFTAVHVHAKGLCRDGWVKAEEFCLKFVKDEVIPWSEAAVKCNFEGGTLVSIDSQSKQDFISKYLTENKGLDSIYWIGGREVKKQWYWMSLSGAPYKQTFQNWYPGEPNDFKGAVEECAEMYGSRENFRWNDYPCTCDHKRSYICEAGFDYGEDVVG